MSLRKTIIEEIYLLSLASEQLAYEKSLINAGHAPTELIGRFCDDLFNPKGSEFNSSFSNEEIKELAHLYGLMIESSNKSYSTVSEMLKDENWRRVISLAKEIYSRYEINN